MKNKYFFMVLLRYLYFPCIFIFRTTSHIYFLHFIIDNFWHFIKPKCRSIDIHRNETQPTRYLRGAFTNNSDQSYWFYVFTFILWVHFRACTFWLSLQWGRWINIILVFFFPHKYLFFHFTKECVWFFHLWFLSFDTISRVQSFAILEKKRCKKKKW